jgi:hypothetical protein
MDWHTAGEKEKEKGGGEPGKNEDYYLAGSVGFFILLSFFAEGANRTSLLWGWSGLRHKHEHSLCPKRTTFCVQ